MTQTSPYQLNEIDLCSELECVRGIEYLETKLELAQSLGLEGQVTLLQKEISEQKHLIRINTKPMSSCEITIWKAFLPTSYSSKNNGRSPGERRYYAYATIDYRFDKIPLPVLEKWAQFERQDLFEHYEIWTPERHRGCGDPALVGVIGKSLFMLARWAESSVDFISFEEIKQTLVERIAANYFWGFKSKKFKNHPVIRAIQEHNQLCGAA